MLNVINLERLAQNGAAILALTILALLIYAFTRHTKKSKTVYKEEDPTDILKDTNYDWRGNKSHQN